MTDHHDAHDGGQRPAKRDDPSPWLVRILMIALVAVGAYYVVTEHGAHVLQAWPLLILLACPLMHLLHGGHGGHRSRNNAGSRNG